MVRRARTVRLIMRCRARTVRLLSPRPRRRLLLLLLHIRPFLFKMEKWVVLERRRVRQNLSKLIQEEEGGGP